MGSVTEGGVRATLGGTVELDGWSATVLAQLGELGLVEARRLEGVLPPEVPRVLRQLVAALAVIGSAQQEPSLPHIEAQSTEMLTVDEAAGRLGKTPATVRRWFNEGRLAGRRVGERVILVERASVEAQVEAAA